MRCKKWTEPLGTFVQYCRAVSMAFHMGSPRYSTYCDGFVILFVAEKLGGETGNGYLSTVETARVLYLQPDAIAPVSMDCYRYSGYA